MKLLLDTHAFLWWLIDPNRLTERARSLITDGATDVLVSAVTGYELTYKAKRGRLELPGEVGDFVTSRLRRSGFGTMALEMPHAVRAADLPLIHQDPFDRLLIAQAQIEGVPLVTADPAITRYDVETIW